MDRQKFEQSCTIQFCVKLGESAIVIYEKSFLEGREQVEDEPRAGRHSNSKTDDNVERERSLVRSDRRLTLRMISS